MNNKLFTRRNNGPNQPRQQNTNYSSLKEDEIGITEYTSKSKGFTGIIKQRYLLSTECLNMIQTCIEAAE